MGEAEDSLIKASNLPLNIKQTSEPRLLRSHQKLPRPPGSDFAPRLLCTSVPGRPRAPHSRPARSPCLRPPGAGAGAGHSHGGGGANRAWGPAGGTPRSAGSWASSSPLTPTPGCQLRSLFAPPCPHWARPGQSTCGDGSPGCAPTTERAAARHIKAK